MIGQRIIQAACYDRLCGGSVFREMGKIFRRKERGLQTAQAIVEVDANVNMYKYYLAWDRVSNSEDNRNKALDGHQDNQAIRQQIKRLRST